jgi:hypothetical protein
MLQLAACARASSSRAAAAAGVGMQNVYTSIFSTSNIWHSPGVFPVEQQQCTQQQQFSSKAGSDESYTPRFSSSTSPEAVTSKGDPEVNDRRSSSDSGHTTFTGTADVFTPSSGNAQQQQQPTVATDSNRSWMSGDDLGTRVEAATNINTTTTASPNQQQQQQDSGSSQQQQQSGGEGATLGVDAATPECHPADPYCQAGEEAPMPDGFHEPEPGDDHIPPSSGFPA